MEWLKEFLPFTSIISALTALVAVIISPIFSWKLAARQITASNVSSKRQVWIDELRKDVAEVLTLTGHIEGLKRPDPNLSPDEILKLFDERAKASIRTLELSIRIRLRLNPNEALHNKLLAAFKNLADSCTDPRPDETQDQRHKLLAEFSKAREEVVKVTQKILKNEWNIVRKGK